MNPSRADNNTLFDLALSLTNTQCNKIWIFPFLLLLRLHFFVFFASKGIKYKTRLNGNHNGKEKRYNERYKCTSTMAALMEIHIFSCLHSRLSLSSIFFMFSTKSNIQRANVSTNLTIHSYATVTKITTTTGHLVNDRPSKITSDGCSLTPHNRTTIRQRCDVYTMKMKTTLTAKSREIRRVINFPIHWKFQYKAKKWNPSELLISFKEKDLPGDPDDLKYKYMKRKLKLANLQNSCVRWYSCWYFVQMLMHTFNSPLLAFTLWWTFLCGYCCCK